jgi:hypothetical protein
MITPDERAIRNRMRGAQARLTRLQNRLAPGVDWTDPQYALDNVVMQIKAQELVLAELQSELTDIAEWHNTATERRLGLL